MRTRSDDRGEPERGRTRSRTRSALIAAGFLAIAFVAAAPSRAASFHLSVTTSDGSSPAAITPGATIDLTIRLTTDLAEPPQAFELVLDWDASRSLAPETQLGVLSLVGLPSALDPTGIVSPDPDCLPDARGRCTFTLDFASPLPVGTTPVVAASVLYDWIPPDGFEICYGLGSDPTCTIEANEREWIDVSVIAADGASGTFGLIETGTLAGVGLRPIPEPSLAVMLGLGLAGLATRRRGAARDTKPGSQAD